mmetsp:Transcript_49492/g.160386  ORF Transcript_49492/g.160386 Transcript_49492/m.160386 type:complete len:217 (-) Transcript_49492:23-673(-)
MSSSRGRMCSSSRSSPAEARLEQLIHIPRIPSDATGAGPSSATTRRKGPCRHSTPRTYSRTAASAPPSTMIVSGIVWPQYSAASSESISRRSEASRRHANTKMAIFGRGAPMANSSRSHTESTDSMRSSPSIECGGGVCSVELPSPASSRLGRRPSCSPSPSSASEESADGAALWSSGPKKKRESERRRRRTMARLCCLDCIERSSQRQAAATTVS